MSDPSTKGEMDEHRNPDGTFKKGHPGGPGNPFAKQSAKFRAALMGAVTEEDVKAIVANVLAIAKGEDGNAKAPDQIAAAKLMLDRVLGPVANTIELGTDTEGGIVFRLVSDKGDDGDDG